MDLKYILGVTSLALSCAATTPEHSEEEVQSAFQNYVAASDAYFCQEFTRLYNKTAATIEERCPLVIPAEMDEVCQAFDQLKDELKRSMDQYCH
ncbi:MAG: hypothetical protein Q8R37_04195 [Nanoarchaeota archaeon]|nr:hypothetical protein [Nanoarchaeota archaeon]